jgi:hypothetical protein
VQWSFAVEFWSLHWCWYISNVSCVRAQPGRGWFRAAEEEYHQRKSFLGLFQVTGVVYMVINLNTLYRHAYQPYGWPAVVVSPGIAWFLLWKALLVHHIYRLVQGPSGR